MMSVGVVLPGLQLGIRWLRVAASRLMGPCARRSTVLVVRYQYPFIGAKGAVKTQGKQQYFVVGEQLMWC